MNLLNNDPYWELDKMNQYRPKLETRDFFSSSPSDHLLHATFFENGNPKYQEGKYKDTAITPRAQTMIISPAVIPQLPHYEPPKAER